MVNEVLRVVGVNFPGSKRGRGGVSVPTLPAVSDRDPGIHAVRGMTRTLPRPRRVGEYRQAASAGCRRCQSSSTTATVVTSSEPRVSQAIRPDQPKLRKMKPLTQPITEEPT